MHSSRARWQGERVTISTRSWARPEAVAFNRLPMTTFLRDARDVESLDGDWSFTLLDRPAGSVRVESTVEVPGCGPVTA